MADYKEEEKFSEEDDIKKEGTFITERGFCSDCGMLLFLPEKKFSMCYCCKKKWDIEGIA